MSIINEKKLDNLVMPLAQVPQTEVLVNPNVETSALTNIQVFKKQMLSIKTNQIPFRPIDSGEPTSARSMMSPTSDESGPFSPRLMSPFSESEEPSTARLMSISSDFDVGSPRPNSPSEFEPLSARPMSPEPNLPARAASPEFDITIEEGVLPPQTENAPKTVLVHRPTFSNLNGLDLASFSDITLVGDVSDRSKLLSDISKKRGCATWPQRLHPDPSKAAEQGKAFDEIYASQVKTMFEDSSKAAKQKLLEKLNPDAEWNLLVPQHDKAAMTQFLNGPDFDLFYDDLTEVMSKMTPPDLKSIRDGHPTPNAREFLRLVDVLDKNGFPNVRGRRINFWSGAKAQEKAFQEGKDLLRLADVMSNMSSLDKESIKAGNATPAAQEFLALVDVLEKSGSPENVRQRTDKFLSGETAPEKVFLPEEFVLCDSQVGATTALLTIYSCIQQEERAPYAISNLMGQAVSTVYASQAFGKVNFYYSDNKETEKFERGYLVGNIYETAELPTLFERKFQKLIEEINNISFDPNEKKWLPPVPMNFDQIYMERRDSHPLDPKSAKSQFYDSISSEWHDNFELFRQNSLPRNSTITQGQLKSHTGRWKEMSKTKGTIKSKVEEWEKKASFWDRLKLMFDSKKLSAYKKS